MATRRTILCSILTAPFAALNIRGTDVHPLLTDTVVNSERLKMKKIIEKMSLSAETQNEITFTDPSEDAVERCQWVREMGFVDGKWKVTRHRHGRLANFGQAATTVAD